MDIQSMTVEELQAKLDGCTARYDREIERKNIKIQNLKAALRIIRATASQGKIWKIADEALGQESLKDYM